MTERFTAQAVQDHYEKLGPEYAEKANQACQRAYREVARKYLYGRNKLLEVGAGSASLLSEIPAPLRVACDLSPAMLRRRTGAEPIHKVRCDAEYLPFAQASFDGLAAINLLEHMPSPRRALYEMARVLQVGGRLLVVTPNGDHEWILNALERLRLKLPEGPHRFLSTEALKRHGSEHFSVVKHESFLAFPTGPRIFVAAVDAFARTLRQSGLFQYAVLEKTKATE